MRSPSKRKMHINIKQEEYKKRVKGNIVGSI